MPLTVGLRPELLKNLRQTPIAPIEDKISVEGSGVIEAADLPKSEFLDLMRQAVTASSSLRKRHRQESEAIVNEDTLSSNGSVQRLAMDRLEQRRRTRIQPIDEANQKRPPGLRQGCPTCARTPGQCPIHK